MDLATETGALRRRLDFPQSSGRGEQNIAFAMQAIENPIAAGSRISSTYHHPYWVVEGRELDERPKPDHIAKLRAAGYPIDDWMQSLAAAQQANGCPN